MRSLPAWVSRPRAVWRPMWMNTRGPASSVETMAEGPDLGRSGGMTTPHTGPRGGGSSPALARDAPAVGHDDSVPVHDGAVDGPDAPVLVRDAPVLARDAAVLVRDAAVPEVGEIAPTLSAGASTLGPSASASGPAATTLSAGASASGTGASALGPGASTSGAGRSGLGTGWERGSRAAVGASRGRRRGSVFVSPASSGTTWWRWTGAGCPVEGGSRDEKGGSGWRSVAPFAGGRSWGAATGRGYLTFFEAHPSPSVGHGHPLLTWRPNKWSWAPALARLGAVPHGWAQPA